METLDYIKSQIYSWDTIDEKGKDFFVDFLVGSVEQNQTKEDIINQLEKDLCYPRFSGENGHQPYGNFKYDINNIKDKIVAIYLRNLLENLTSENLSPENVSNSKKLVTYTFDELMQFDPAKIIKEIKKLVVREEVEDREEVKDRKGWQQSLRLMIADNIQKIGEWAPKAKVAILDPQREKAEEPEGEELKKTSKDIQDYEESLEREKQSRESLEREKQNLEQEKSTLQNEYGNKLRDLERGLRSKEAELKTAQEQLTELIIKNRAKEETTLEENARREKLEKQNRESLERERQNGESLERERQKNQSKETELLKLRQEKQALEQQVRDLRKNEENFRLIATQSAENVKKDIQNLTKETTRYKVENEALRAENQKLKQETDARIHGLQSTIQATIQAREKQNAALRAENQKLKQEMNAQIRELRSTIRARETQNAALHAENQKLKQETDARIHELQSTIQALEEQNAALCAENQKLKQEMKAQIHDSQQSKQITKKGNLRSHEEDQKLRGGNWIQKIMKKLESIIRSLISKIGSSTESVASMNPNNNDESDNLPNFDNNIPTRTPESTQKPASISRNP